MKNVLLKIKLTLFFILFCSINGMIFSESYNLDLTIEERSWLSNQNEIIIGIMDAWPPMDYVDSSGKFQGIGVDFINLINPMLDSRIKIVAGPWHDIYNQCLNKKIDALMDITPRSEREEFFNFTQIYVDIPHLIIAQDNGPYYENIASLNGKRLAVERGYGIVSHVKETYPEITIKEYDSTSDALDAVAKGEAEAYIGNRAVAKYIIDRELLNGLQFQSKIKATKSSNSIGVRKDLPLLASILDKSITAIPEDKKLKVFRKWNAISDKASLIELTRYESDWIQQHSIIKIGADANWAPVEFKDKNGEFHGISRDFLELIETKTGLRFIMESAENWAATIEKVKNREMDMYSAVVKTPLRSEYMNFSEPYIGLFNVIFTREEEPYIPDLNELNQRKVAVIKGYAIEEFLKKEYPEIDLISVEDVDHGLKLLSTSEVTAYIDALLTTSYIIQQKGFANIKVAGNTPFHYDLSMAVRKDWPILLTIITKALDSISAEEKNKIFRKWRSIRVEENFDYNVLWRLLFPVLSGLAVLVFWIYRLRVEIVKRKKAEVELMAAKEYAESANKAKSIFLANMSHEIRTPMNAILGYSQILLNESNIEKSQRSHIKAIFRSGNHLLELINEVLDMSKIEAGKISIHKTGFSLKNLLEECYEMFKLRADEKALKLTKNLNLPDYIYSDKNRIRQIVINLIGNALKFTNKGSINIKAELRADKVCIEIEDTGRGIEENNFEKIFHAFEQAGDSSDGGTGLGLAISKKMAGLLGGTLNVESRKGIGSKFIFSFPYEEVRIQKEEIKRKKKRIIRLQNEFLSTKILITDDRMENRKVVRKLLKPYGFDIRESSNGKETLEIISQWKPSILLLDIVMPDMNGFQVTSFLRESEIGQNITIIAMSASVIEVQKNDILKIGAHAFIQKPFFIDDLLKTIEETANIKFNYENNDSNNSTGLEIDYEKDIQTDKLPLSLVERIFKATVMGDIEALHLLSEEVKIIDQKAAFYLNRQIDKFNLESIKKVFHN